ncbi:MAG: tRNA-dihydrouridine(20/20a) synthase (EC [uncultured Paraburkholderia sp.]|nr:MAG: tRNA-dihydrouridine(20/20a) synthase (EC [uncultured Paraburkholderia sp.]
MRRAKRPRAGDFPRCGKIAVSIQAVWPLMSLPRPASPRRVSVAPMMDWTDRHCRSLHRMISRHTWLYTEMVTTGALLHGDVPRHLAFTPDEAPVALQLGGSEPDDLARSAKLGEQWGYDEINLNCGCPSERVQRGAFGACLMNEPQLVADCVKAMRDVVSVPVTVKHRIGVDAVEDYSFVRDFVGTVAQAGCEVFIVHARNAILKGLSPKENREIPPLKYDYAYRLKRDFPQLEIVINGGIKTLDEVEMHLHQHVDGVMLGREAYHNPYLLADVDTRFYGSSEAPLTREQVEAKLVEYCAAEMARGTYLGAITRHALGLYRGEAGARGWRRVLSDSKRLAARDLAIFDEARQHLREPVEIFE